MEKQFVSEPVITECNGNKNGSDLVKIASTTCYRSEDTTTRSGGEFIKMLKENGHESPLEFSWFTFRILVKLGSKEAHDEMMKNINYYYLASSPYIKITYSEKGIFVSANGRAWRDHLAKEDHHLYADKLILFQLKKLLPELFEDLKGERSQDGRYVINLIKDKTINTLPDHEKEQHAWIMFKLHHVSRGLTHELVRHRILSFAQASTRYIDNSNFVYVLPLDAQEKIQESNPILYGTIFVLITLQKLVYTGIKKILGNGMARQFLPVGISNEICVAGNLDAWKKFLELRTAKNAHWEIKNVALKIKKILEDKKFL